jgi:hypothetical protein
MDCAICTGELDDPFVLSCGHTYCKQCISTWFHGGQGSNKRCPICKARIREKLPMFNIGLFITPIPRRPLSAAARRLSAGSPTSSTTSSLTLSPLSDSRDDTRISMRFVNGRGGIVEVRESGNRYTSILCVPVKLFACYWTGYLIFNVILHLRMRGMASHIFYIMQGGLLYVLCIVLGDIVRHFDTCGAPYALSPTLSD